MPTLTLKTLRDDRRALIGWSLGLAAVVAMYLAFYPSLNTPDMQRFMGDFLSSMPEGVAAAMGWNSFLGGAGYLEATVYNLYGPILLIAAAAVFGNRAIAGPENAGTLDIYLANPIGRRPYVLQRFAALTVEVLVIGVVVWLTVALLNVAVDLEVPLANITAATAGLTLLGLCFGAIAVATGAIAGRRSAVLAVTLGFAVVSYLVRAVGVQVDLIHDLRWLSPFYYYLGGDPLREGFDAVGLLVLAGVSVLFVAIAAVAFERRDVAV
ncbi:ABC-2 transporter permease [Flindersiella endophytica]